MNIKKWGTIPALVLLFLCNVSAQEIITTTSILSSAVKEIVQDKYTAETLVPSGYCPGHFDIKGKHLAEIEKSGLLFAQGYEPYLEQVTGSIKNPDFSPLVIESEGTWFSFESQKKIYTQITKILSERLPQNRGFFESNLKNALIEIEKTDREVKELTQKHKISGISVICNTHIKDMLLYLGLNVTATYGRQEELTPSGIKNIIDTARRGKLFMVIDNLQAGPDTGKVIADELKIPHITVSNFPDAFPQTPTLRQTLYRNAELIIDTYEKYKDKVK